MSPRGKVKSLIGNISPRGKVKSLIGNHVTQGEGEELDR